MSRTFDFTELFFVRYVVQRKPSPPAVVQVDEVEHHHRRGRGAGGVVRVLVQEAGRAVEVQSPDGAGVRGQRHQAREEQQDGEQRGGASQARHAIDSSGWWTARTRPAAGVPGAPRGRGWTACVRATSRPIVPIASLIAGRGAGALQRLTGADRRASGSRAGSGTRPPYPGGPDHGLARPKQIRMRLLTLDLPESPRCARG